MHNPRNQVPTSYYAIIINNNNNINKIEYYQKKKIFYKFVNFKFNLYLGVIITCFNKFKI